MNKEMALINNFFYNHDVPVMVGYRLKNGARAILNTPGYTRYTLIPYAGKMRFSEVFRMHRELESFLSRSRGQAVRVRFDEVEFALEVPRTDPVNLDYASVHVAPFTARIGRSYAFGKIQENYLDLTDSNSAHTLIAGITGSGKSEMLRNIAVDLLDNNSPDALHVLMIDLKNRGLRPFATCPHVRAFASEPEQATAIVKWLKGEMEKRRKAGDVSEPRIVLFIDELAEFASECGKTVVDEELPSLARMGRELGINIIATAQKPDAKLIGGQLKSQFGVKLVGLLDSASTAAHITGRRHSGAESLPGKGAMLLIRDGAQPVRVQGYLVGEAVTPCAAQVTARYEALRLPAIALPVVDEVASNARKAKPEFEKHYRDGKLQNGGVSAVVTAIYGEGARNAGDKNHMARQVINYLMNKGNPHAEKRPN